VLSCQLLRFVHLNTPLGVAEFLRKLAAPCRQEDFIHQALVIQAYWLCGFRRHCRRSTPSRLKPIHRIAQVRFASQRKSREAGCHDSVCSGQVIYAGPSPRLDCKNVEPVGIKILVDDFGLPIGLYVLIGAGWPRNT